MGTFKVDTEIRVRYGAVGAQIGISDLEMDIIDPNGDGVSGFPVTMSELGNGIYESAFTPTSTGIWWIKITSATSPENGYSKSYIVSQTSSYEGQPFALVDQEGHYAVITTSGRLKVSQEPPTAPPNTTSVVRTEYGNVSNEDDDVYVIPNGETIYIQRLSAGSEEGNGGSVVELWYDPNGDGTGMTIIDAVQVQGNSGQHDLNSEYTGDGTIAIRMRRKRYGGGAVQIFGRWEGYY